MLWILSGVFFLLAFVFLLTADSQTVYSVSSLLSSPHETECILCGMTESCINIAGGNITGAMNSNKMAVPLFASLVLNFLLLSVYLLKKNIKGKV